LLNAFTLEVRVPTEAVVVSYSSLRKQPVSEAPTSMSRTTAPLAIANDTSAAGAVKRVIRKLNPWTEQVWWMVFVALAGVKMMRSWIGLRHLRGASRRAPDEMRDACGRVADASTLRVAPEVRISAHVGSPLLTSGRQPVIWLPEESVDWTAAKLGAVLHHEIAHLVRRDSYWQRLATVAACFWWWNPAVWFALARLKGETELAADELVLLRKVSAPDYARALVEIASALLPRPASAFGVPMLGVSAIEQRVRAMLLANPWRGKIGTLATTALAMLAVLMGSIVLVSCKQKPPTYISLAKLVAGARMVGPGGASGIQYQDYLADFYGTIIESIESRELRRRALDRVRALHPDLKESEVEIQASQNKGSAIFNIRATGAEPKYTRVFLDALLDEFVAFRNQIREQQRNKALTTLAEDVVRREKSLQEKQDKLITFEKANNIVALSLTNNNLAQGLRKLKEERDQKLTAMSYHPLAMQDVSLALRQRDRDASLARQQGSGSTPAGLTRLEDDFLQKQQALVVSKAELAFLEKKKGAADPKTVEIAEAVEKQEVVLRILEEQVKIQLASENAGAERRVVVLDSLIKDREGEAKGAGAKIAAHDALKKDYDDSKKAHDDILDLVRRFTVGENLTSEHVTIMERASGAVEDVSRGWFWKPAAKAATDK
jgi:beta-lactamase regulating signal transducer with metallopeptidase domain